MITTMTQSAEHNIPVPVTPKVKVTGRVQMFCLQLFDITEDFK